MRYMNYLDLNTYSVVVYYATVDGLIGNDGSTGQ